MFWKKKKHNTEITFEALPSGELFVRIHLGDNRDPNVLAIILNSIFGKDPQILEGMVRAIDFWSKKDGWVKEGLFVKQNFIQFNTGNRTNVKTKVPLIQPDQVLPHLSKDMQK